MSGAGRDSAPVEIVPPDRAPQVTLQRIGEITTLEVMEVELDSLNDAVSEENQALGFWTASGGVFVANIVGRIAEAWVFDAVQAAVFWSVTVVFGLATAWFFLRWLRARKKRPQLIGKIRSRLRRSDALRPEGDTRT